jgi:signal transduction histidine kinase
MPRVSIQNGSEIPITESGRKAFHLHTHVIPLTRLAGLATITALIAVHNLAVLGDANWPSVWTFAYVATFYGSGSLLTLRVFFLQSKRLHLGTLFLILDVVLLIFAIHLTGGTTSWLFLLLAARCTDQIFFGVRRVIWFGHLLVGSYALYAAMIAMSQHSVSWEIEAAKLAILYAFTWYYAVTARTVDLVRRRSKRSNVAKRRQTELIGTVRHAISTRAAAVAAVLESLRRTSLDPKQMEHLRVLTDFNHSLSRLANVLNGSDNEAGQLEIEQGTFAPVEIVADVALLVQPLAESKGLSLRIDVTDAKSALVTGDSGKIRQALISLAHNAIRFTDSGFVELRVRQVQPDRVAFEVRDSGAGIPLQMQRRLFASFLRADGTPWHRTHGRGSGLGISRHLVESMGGTVEMESVMGLGTTVRFSLNLPEFALAECEPPGLAVSTTDLWQPSADVIDCSERSPSWRTS